MIFHFHENPMLDLIGGYGFCCSAASCCVLLCYRGSAWLRKMVAPGIYYISSPLLAMIGVLLVCAVMVYVVVPLFAMAGIYFNNAAKAKQKKEKIIKALKKALEPLLPDAGLSWTDVQDMKLWCAVLYRVTVVYGHVGQPWPAMASP